MRTRRASLSSRPAVKVFETAETLLVIRYQFWIVLVHTIIMSVNYLFSNQALIICIMHLHLANIDCNRIRLRLPGAFIVREGTITVHKVRTPSICHQNGIWPPHTRLQAIPSHRRHLVPDESALVHGSRAKIYETVSSEGVCHWQTTWRKPSPSPAHLAQGLWCSVLCCEPSHLSATHPNLHSRSHYLPIAARVI